MDNSATKTDIAARLKVARARLFPTAAAAARALGMNPITVRAHESGQNGVDYFDLERYARRYGVDIGWLLIGKGPQEPKAEFHVEFGEQVPIFGLIKDGAWVPDDEEGSLEYPILHVRPPTHGGQEFAVYGDPRFPGDLIEGYRVAADREDPAYLDGSLVFAVPAHLIGFRPGDHVIIVRDDRNKNFVEWTLRKVSESDHGIIYEALQSHDEPFPYSDSNHDGILTDIRGVVIGSIQRRPVNELTIESRRDLEKFSRGGSAEGPKRPDWLERWNDYLDNRILNDFTAEEIAAMDIDAMRMRASKPKKKRNA